MTCCGFDWLSLKIFFYLHPWLRWRKHLLASGSRRMETWSRCGVGTMVPTLCGLVWTWQHLENQVEWKSRGWNVLFFFKFPISVTQFHRVSIKCDCAAVVVTFVLQNKELFPLTSEDLSWWLWLLRTWKLQRNKQKKLNLKTKMFCLLNSKPFRNQWVTAWQIPVKVTITKNTAINICMRKRVYGIGLNPNVEIYCVASGALINMHF